MLLAFWLLSLVALKAQNGNEPMKVTDLLRVRTLGTLSLNKDGSKALFTVLSTEPDGDSKLEFKNNTQIWLANTDGSAEPKQLTGKDNAFQSRWKTNCICKSGRRKITDLFIAIGWRRSHPAHPA